MMPTMLVLKWMSFVWAVSEYILGLTDSLHLGKIIVPNCKKTLDKTNVLCYNLIIDNKNKGIHMNEGWDD